MSATLTSQLNMGTTYTSIPVTALPNIIPLGGVIFVSQGLSNVEAFTTSLSAHVGDTTIHVQSQMAAHTHPIGDPVTPSYLLTAVGRTLTPIQTPRTKKL